MPTVAPLGTYLLALPALYFVADLAEDITLARLLTSSNLITERSVTTLQLLTRAKLVTVGLARAQTTLLLLIRGAVALFSRGVTAQ